MSIAGELAKLRPNTTPESVVLPGADGPPAPMGTRSLGLLQQLMNGETIRIQCDPRDGGAFLWLAFLLPAQRQFLLVLDGGNAEVTLLPNGPTKPPRDLLYRELAACHAFADQIRVVNDWPGYCRRLRIRQMKRLARRITRAVVTITLVVAVLYSGWWVYRAWQYHTELSVCREALKKKEFKEARQSFQKLRSLRPRAPEVTELESELKKAEGEPTP